MEINDKVVVVTGGGSGIGRALCERFARAVRADAPDAQWQRHWDVNVMAHVCAARAGLRDQVMRTGS